MVDVCVVGSGSAGATAAWELARAGRDVVVLEEGGDFVGGMLTMRDGMYDQLYMDRGGRATDDLAVSVLQGRVLGGGGVINACDVVPIPSAVARCWEKRFGLAGLSPEALAPFAAEALRDLSANLPTDAQVNANNRVLRDGAASLGWRGEVMLHNRRGCHGLGKCLVGCPIGAKQNPRAVAIPAALERGARFFTRARAVRLEGASGEVKTVHVRRLDPRGYHETGSFSLRARTVVLAANAIASTQLLLRSGLGNEHVGRHVMLQPQLPISALLDREVALFRGIPQSYAVTEFEEEDEDRGIWGFRIEGIGGTPGIVASTLPWLGARGKDTMAHLPHLAAALLLVPDAPNGRVTLDERGRPRIAYAMPEEQKLRYRQAAKAAARLYLAVGARQIVVPTARPVVITKESDLAAIDGLQFEPATTPLLSAHQQGGVRFSSSPRDGAADPTGLVFGTRGVYALDSAGYPTSASSHTMAPIITTARLLARALAG